MKLAGAEFGFPGLSPDFVWDLLHELQLEGVSMAFFGDGITARSPQEIAADPERWGERVASALAERELAAADIFMVPSGDLAGGAVNNPDGAEVAVGAELFDGFVTFGGRVGVSGLTILPGLVFGGESWQTAFDRSVEGLKRRLESAREGGLRLSVEPHIVNTSPYVGSVIDTPTKVEALLEAVPGLELTLDYGHFNVQGIPDREVEPLLAHARHFHVRGGAEGMVQTKFEDNVTDFGRALDVLAELDYDGWVEIEYVHDTRPGCSECDNIQETIKFRDFLRGHEAEAGR